jgi:hypothetical protein
MEKWIPDLPVSKLPSNICWLPGGAYAAQKLMGLSNLITQPVLGCHEDGINRFEQS